MGELEAYLVQLSQYDTKGNPPVNIVNTVNYNYNEKIIIIRIRYFNLDI